VHHLLAFAQVTRTQQLPTKKTTRQLSFRGEKTTGSTRPGLAYPRHRERRLSHDCFSLIVGGLYSVTALRKNNMCQEILFKEPNPVGGLYSFINSTKKGRRVPRDVSVLALP